MSITLHVIYKGKPLLQPKYKIESSDQIPIKELIKESR